MKKQIVIIAILIVALGFGGVWLSAYGKDAASIAAQKKSSLLATEQLNVSFQQVGGRITEIFIQESQHVEKGAPLMKLDTSDLDFQLEQLKIQMAMMDSQILQAQGSLQDYDINIQQYTTQTAQENLTTAQNHYERVKILHDSGAASQTSLEEAQQKVTTAANTFQQNQELLGKYQHNLELGNINVTLLEEQKKSLAVQLESLLSQKERMFLHAPASGRVLTLVPKVGENVTANSPVIVLQSSALYFDLYVAETQVENFQVSGTVPVYIVAKDCIIPGTVRYITSAPQFTSSRMSRDSGQADISSFQVRIGLEESAADLLPGMTVEVRLDETV